MRERHVRQVCLQCAARHHREAHRHAGRQTRPHQRGRRALEFLFADRAHRFVQHCRARRHPAFGVLAFLAVQCGHVLAIAAFAAICALPIAEPAHVRAGLPGSRFWTVMLPLGSRMANSTICRSLQPCLRIDDTKLLRGILQRFSTSSNSSPSRASSTGCPCSQRSPRVKCVAIQVLIQSSNNSTATTIRPPCSDLSSPISEVRTALPSTITTIRSKMLSSPSVCLPDSRISANSTMYTMTARTTSCHHGVSNSNIPSIASSRSGRNRTSACAASSDGERHARSPGGERLVPLERLIDGLGGRSGLRVSLLRVEPLPLSPDFVTRLPVHLRATLLRRLACSSRLDAPVLCIACH